MEPLKEILDSKENKAAFVKARPIIEDNAMLIDDIKEAIAELKLVRQSKLQARPARDLISELF